MEFFRQEYWSGLPFPPPENLPDPGIELCFLHLLHWRRILYLWATWGVVCNLHRLNNIEAHFSFMWFPNKQSEEISCWGSLAIISTWLPFWNSKQFFKCWPSLCGKTGKSGHKIHDQIVPCIILAHTSLPEFSHKDTSNCKSNCNLKMIVCEPR